MYLLACDESNRNPSDRRRFFIYGGIIVDGDNCLTIHQFFERLRIQYGITSGWNLKFDAAARPATLSAERFAEVKNRVLEAAPGWGVRFIAYVVHHRIADTRAKQERAFRSAMNTILYQFNGFLRQHDDHGVFLIDRFDGGACLDLLKSIFTRGLDLPAQNARRAIDRVTMMGASCLGASHLMSLLDIVLGAFRYCVNARAEKFEVARLLYSKLQPLLVTAPGNPRVEEWGLFLRPQEVRAADIQAEYTQLRQHLARLGQPERAV
ncbi:MAG: hypothetical protein ACE14M_10220 [Terriglobales bacterium]